MRPASSLAHLNSVQVPLSVQPQRQQQAEHWQVAQPLEPRNLVAEPSKQPPPFLVEPQRLIRSVKPHLAQVVFRVRSPGQQVLPKQVDQQP